MPLQPRGNIPIAANITFLEDSLGQYKKNFQYIHQQVLDKRCVWIKIFVIYLFKNYIIFEAPPTGQPKNYAMEKWGYLG